MLLNKVSFKAYLYNCCRIPLMMLINCNFNITVSQFSNGKQIGKGDDVFLYL